MVNLPYILRYLFPNATPLRHYTVSEGEIVWWDNVALGPKPSQGALETTAASPEFQAWFAEHGGDPAATARREARELGASPEPLPRGVRALGLLTLDGFNGDRALIGACLDLIIAMANVIGASAIVSSAQAVKAQIPSQMTDDQGESLRQRIVDSGR